MVPDDAMCHQYPPKFTFHIQLAHTDGEVLALFTVLYRTVYFLIIKLLGLTEGDAQSLRSA